MMFARVTRHVGNRGFVLIALGLIWTLSAVGLFTVPRPTLGVPEEYIPQDVRAFAFYLIPGLVAMAGGVWKRLDATAWGLLMAAPAARFLSFGLDWAFGPWMQDHHRYPQDWLAMLSMATVCFLLYFSAAGLDRAPRYMLPEPITGGR